MNAPRSMVMPYGRKAGAVVLLVSATVWLGSAAQASFRSQSVVEAFFMAKARELGLTLTREEVMRDVDVVWAFSPLPPLHFASLDLVAGGCGFRKHFLFLAWGKEPKVLWEAGG